MCVITDQVAIVARLREKKGCFNVLTVTNAGGRRWSILQQGACTERNHYRGHTVVIVVATVKLQLAPFIHSRTASKRNAYACTRPLVHRRSSL